ncbi:hypothetical protein [Sulfuriferula nivalis]|uniref:Pellicle/biofilm biosynthesis protein PelE n=1 Tax=Sulfuriferula nivalis TaxID=2675298 RepID=A0A809RHG2_9PROT|nr:hypothetical protein [Sulfuriferula nivalis]BBP00284.1 pellicle/biofilm biosynthesis protein PelE [Sulfuriferula nivalis]
MLLNNKLILAGISLESAALAVLNQDISVPLQLFGYVSLHAAASLIVAYLALLFLPSQYRQPKLAVIGLFFLFAFLVPFLTIITIIAIIITTRYFSKPVIYYPFIKIGLPQFTLGSAGIRHTLGEAAIQTRLNTPGLSTEVRMKALLTANIMSPRYSIPMLKALLGDEADDLRLLAYGMLDNREKTLNALIHDLLKKLSTCNSPDLKHLYQKQLTELYWAFVYEQLAEGDMRTYMLNQSEKYALSALEIKEDGDLWVLLAQILVKQEKALAAEAAFKHAQRLGIPATRISPYLAELAFLKQNYPQVRKYLSELQQDNQIRPIANIVKFWQGART